MTRTALIDIAPEDPATATGPAKDLMETAQTKLGFLPNMYRYMAAFPPILEGYMASYDAFRQQSGFTPAEQETVLLTISRINGCGYCMAAHSMIAAKKSGVPADSLAALRDGRRLPDEKLQAVAALTAAMVETRGTPDRAAIDAFRKAGYGEQQVLGIVLAIACKTFSNYVNHLAGTPVDEVFADYEMA